MLQAFKPISIENLINMQARPAQDPPPTPKNHQAPPNHYQTLVKCSRGQILKQCINHMRFQKRSHDSHKTTQSSLPSASMCKRFVKHTAGCSSSSASSSCSPSRLSSSSFSKRDLQTGISLLNNAPC